jgi:hypothetical protein
MMGAENLSVVSRKLPLSCVIVSTADPFVCK